MNKEAKAFLKDRYNKYKESYISLKNEIKNVPRGSVEYYEIIGEISGVKAEIAKIRLCLFSEIFRKIYLSNLLAGKEQIEKGGR